MTLLPAANAGAIFFIAINKGWLKGGYLGQLPPEGRVVYSLEAVPVSVRQKP